MAGSSGSLHESEAVLKPETIDRHRAVVSIMEELEAVDWYDQRIDAATDSELKKILAHNRDEEKEHASMMLEWLRRHERSAARACADLVRRLEGDRRRSDPHAQDAAGSTTSGRLRRSARLGCG